MGGDGDVTPDFEICNYGYWVGPEGQIEPIPGFERHQEAAPGICDKHGIAYERSEVSEGMTSTEANKALGDMGWSHVTICCYSAGVEFTADWMDPPALLGAIAKIVRAHKDTAGHFRNNHKEVANAREMQSILYMASRKAEDRLKNGLPKLTTPTPSARRSRAFDVVGD